MALDNPSPLIDSPPDGAWSPSRAIIHGGEAVTGDGFSSTLGRGTPQIKVNRSDREINIELKAQRRRRVYRRSWRLIVMASAAFS